MTLIASNGTGGGDFASAATWRGSVVPTDTDVFLILPGDTVTISTVVTLMSGTHAVGTSGDATSAGQARLQIQDSGSLIINSLAHFANGVIEVTTNSAGINLAGILGWYGGDFLLDNYNTYAGSISGSGCLQCMGFESSTTVRTIIIRNPHYLQLPLIDSGQAIFQFGPNGAGMSYGPGGHLFDFVFDTAPAILVGLTPFAAPAAGIEFLAVDKNYVAPGDPIADYAYNWNAFAAQWLPYVCPVLNGSVLSAVTVELWSISDTQWQWSLTIPGDAPLGENLLVSTYADDGAGNWTIQQLRADIAEAWATANASTFTGVFPASVLAKAPTGGSVISQTPPIVPGEMKVFRYGAFVQPGAGIPQQIGVTDCKGNPISLAGRTIEILATSPANRQHVLWKWTTADALTIVGANSNVIQIDADNTNSQTAGDFLLFAWDVTGGTRTAIPEASVRLVVLPAPQPQ